MESILFDQETSDPQPLAQPDERNTVLSVLIFGAGGGGGGGSGGGQGGGGGGGGGGSLGIAVPVRLDFTQWDHYVILGAPGSGGINTVNEGTPGGDGKATILFRTARGAGPNGRRDVLVAIPGARGGKGGGEGPGGGPRGPLGGAGGAGGGIGGAGGAGGGAMLEKPANAGKDGGSTLGIVFGPFEWPTPHTEENASRNFGAGGSPAVFAEGSAGGGGGGGAGHGKGGDGGTRSNLAQNGARGGGGGGGSAWAGDPSPGKGGTGGWGFLEAYPLP